jgi:DNA-binding transcriptional ArsR family regulator
MNGMADLPTPQQVARFLEAFGGAPTRVTVVRVLMKGPRTYTDLFNEIGEDVMSRGAVYSALHELKIRGYVEDDAPNDVVRRLKRTLFWANKQLIADDLGATVAYFLV